MKEWIKDPNNVYIGRAGVVFINKQQYPKQISILANPFKITPTCTRKESLKLYKREN
jgi:hypothetical protein